MKNKNKANAGRTQIADISVAGKELSEEHLRIVGGGLLGGFAISPNRFYTTQHCPKTCQNCGPGGSAGCCYYEYDCGTPTLDWGVPPTA